MLEACLRHSAQSGNPATRDTRFLGWIPAFAALAGMTGAVLRVDSIAAMHSLTSRS